MTTLFDLPPAPTADPTRGQPWPWPIHPDAHLHTNPRCAAMQPGQWVWCDREPGHDGHHAELRHRTGTVGAVWANREPVRVGTFLTAALAERLGMTEQQVLARLEEAR